MTVKKDEPVSPPAAQADGEAAVKATVDALQKATDEAEAKGFWGTEVDHTPRENYTVSGVVAAKPTPETDK